MAKLCTALYDRLAAGLLSAIKMTLKVEIVNHPLKEPVIYAFLHRNLIYCALIRAGDPIVVMASASKDGQLIAGPLKRLGYEIVNGSSSKGGSKALKAMLKYSKTHSMAITPDGPKGPLGIVHPGLFHLALFAKIPIVAVAVKAKREWVFNSWDRFRFPKPFAKVKLEYSEPIWVKSKEDIAEAERSYKQYLKEKEGAIFLD